MKNLFIPYYYVFLKTGDKYSKIVLLITESGCRISDFTMTLSDRILFNIIPLLPAMRSSLKAETYN